MIIYGFMNYGYFSKDRNWKGARSVMNRYIGNGIAPEFMQKFNPNNPQYASSTCIRYAEHMLGLSPNSIKWPQSTLAEENKLKATQSGIFSPAYAPAEEKEVGKYVPPFNNHNARLLGVNLQALHHNINFEDIVQNKNHKAYVLLLVASFMALGNRMFFEAAANPDLVPSDYNELNIYKMILRSTKLHAPISAGNMIRRFDPYMNAKVYDFTPTIIHGYTTLIQSHPNLHVEEVSKLSAAASKFVKSTRLIQ